MCILYRLSSGTLAGGYRVVDEGPLYVDLLVGGRLVSLDTEIRLEGPLTTREADKSGSTISPLFAARTHIPLSHNLALGIYGDVGGFAGFDVKWQMAGTVHWDISDHWSLLGGYRYMAIHHDKADHEFDVALGGPLIGVTYRF